MTPHELLEELGRVLEYVRASGECQPDVKSLSSKLLLSQIAGGQSPSKALFMTCHGNDSDVGRMIFGSQMPLYDEDTQILCASDDGRVLQVTLLQQDELSSASCASQPYAVILCTDFRTFRFYRRDCKGNFARPFVVLDRTQISEELAFTGTIWNTIYPTHHAIVSRTVAYSFPKATEGALFPRTFAGVDALNEERTAYDQLGCLADHFSQLLSLDALCADLQSTVKPPKVLSTHKDGSYTMRRYAPQRSALFDYGHGHVEHSRGDIVTTYNVGEEEFHREFFVSPSKHYKHDAELRVAVFDILHMLAIRRAKLFRSGFASRVYNVLLPPVLLTDDCGPAFGYAVFPCLTLYRAPLKGFRRTVSLTLLVCPLEIKQTNDGTAHQIVSRIAYLDELYGIKSDLLLTVVDPAAAAQRKQYRITSPADAYIALPNECTLPELLRHVSKVVLHRMLLNKEVPANTTDTLVNSTLFLANQESRIATMSLIVDWKSPEGYTQPWERWVTAGQDSGFRNCLFRTLFYRDYLNPEWSEASQHAVQLAKFNIGNTLGADMGGMTLYKPQEALKLVLYPDTREQYPDYSVIRWMTWQIYIDSAIASLRALLNRFNPILEERGDLRSIIAALDEMMDEFVDLYDLDIRDYFYRKEYEKLRELVQIDSDYAQLLARFSASKEDESLREQRLINKLVVSLTISTVTLTVVSTIAQVGKLSIQHYLIIAGAASTLLVWVGYRLFDPINLRLTRFYRRIARIFK